MKRVLLFLSASCNVALLLAANLFEFPNDTISKRINLEEVVVKATRQNYKSPFVHSNIEKEEITKTNYGQDIPFLISLTPSVITTSDAGTGIGYTGMRIRGTDANRINIMVNGIPLNDAESHSVFWVNMPDFASNIENIQVQRGAGSSTIGAGSFGASVNLKTENLNPKVYAAYDCSFGSFGTRKNSFKVGTGLIKNHFAFDVRLSDVQSNGYIDRASVNLQSYYASGVYYNGNTSIKLITFQGKEKTYQAWTGVPSSILSTNRTYNPCGKYIDDNGVLNYYNNETDNYSQTHYQLFAVHEINSALNTSLTLHYTKGNGYYENYVFEAIFSKYLLEKYANKEDTSNLICQKWLDNDFYGMVYSLNYSSSLIKASFGASANRYDGNHFGKVIWVKNIQNLEPNHEWYRGTGDKRDYNVYGKMNLDFTENLSLYFDMQYRHIAYKIDGLDDKRRDVTQNHFYNFYNPKAGLYYSINNNNQIYYSFAITNREPNRDNFTEAISGKAPLNETLYDNEIGYVFDNKDMKLGVNFYYMKYKNQLIRTGQINDVGNALTSNIPDSYRTGIEFTSALKLTSFLNWDGNLTLSQNKIEKFTEYVDNYIKKNENSNPEWIGQIQNNIGTTKIAFSPDIIANSIINLNWKEFNLLFLSYYVSRQYADNSWSKDRSIDAYFINNIITSYTIKTKYFDKIVLGFLVNNLLNEKYETNAWIYSYYQNGTRCIDDGYFTQAVRNFIFRITIKI